MAKKLEKLSKADLIWIIERMSAFGQERYLNQALNELRYEKANQRIAEAERIAHLADEKRRAYCNFM